MSIHFVSVLTLVLALVACRAEGFTLYEQREIPQVAWPRLHSGIGQVILDLSGRWEVADREDGDYQEAWLPACFPAQDHALYFRRRFVLPDSLKGYHFELVIPEVHYRIEVRVNGSFVSSFTGSHLGFSSDIARNHLLFGSSNEIVLKVESRLSATSTLPVAPQLLQPVRYGGIFSGIYVRGVPSWCIEDASLRLEPGRLDSTSLHAAVRVRIARFDASSNTESVSRAERDLRLVCSIQDSAGRRVVEARSDKVEPGNSGNFHANVDFPRFSAGLWSPGNPILYSLRIFLISDADTVHEFSRTVGFKETLVQAGRIKLNGSPFRIRGMDYVPESERGRRAIGYQQLKSDLARIKGLGMNTVRVPFGPPPPILLSLTDELGLLVLVDTGLDWIPPSVMAGQEYRQLVRHTMERLAEETSDHVSLLAYGLGSFLIFDDERTVDVIQECRTIISRRHDHLTYVETFDQNRVGSLANFVLTARHPIFGGKLAANTVESQLAVVESRIGYPADARNAALFDASAGIVKQADFLVRQVLAADADTSLSGFLLHAYSDYHGHFPLTAQPRRVDPTLYSFGMVGVDRQERIAYFKMRDLAQTGQVSPPVPGERRTTPPIVFPVAGLSAILLVSIELRRNNVFRQNLRRVFLHAHGFYSDLRYRRFLHTAQPLILWVTESLTLGLLVASILYSYRESFRFDYYLTLLVPWPSIKADLIGVVWQPLQLAALMTVIVLIGLVGKMLLVRLLSLFFRERVDLWQSANYVLWAYAGLLFLLPLAAVLYRVLELGVFTSAVLILVGLVILWCVARLLAALRTGFGTTNARIYAVFLALLVVTLGGLLLVANNGLGVFTYVPFFNHVSSML